MSSNRVADITHGFDLECMVVCRIADTINSPRSLAVKLLVEHGEWQQLMDLTVDPDDYEDVGNFADDYLITSILSKSPNVPLGIDRASVALNSFYEAEKTCAEANLRLVGEKPSWFRIFRDRLRSVLGPCDRRALDYIEARMSHGPGATTGVPGWGSIGPMKFENELHLTQSLIPFAKVLMGPRWHELYNSPFIVVDGNRFTTVPKNAKTDRGICVEPTLNLYGQKGIGAFIRKRLKHFSIDLNSQENNQDMARRAFKEGLCTIDLSMASDTMCRELIWQTLDLEWVELLTMFRSPVTQMPDGTCVKLEKFSSMGNGFTFELESLFFFSLARTIVPREEWDRISVFGDDIIIPAQHAHPFIEALNFLGFKTNGAKSYLAGNFFESCGTDWFKGLNVRPFYLRGKNDSGIPYQLQIANSLRLYAARVCSSGFCDSRFRHIWNTLVDSLPTWVRDCKVSPDLGDQGLIVSDDEARHLPLAPDGLEGRITKILRVQMAKRHHEHYGALLFALHDLCGTDFSKNMFVLRGVYRRMRTKRAIVRWPKGLSWF